MVAADPPSPNATRRPRTAHALAFRIAEHTARAIETGELRQGDRIREEALARQFECSRSPVREALRLLESRALVVIEPLKGARVVRVDEADFHEVFHIRRGLGAVVARLAAERGAPEAKAALLDCAQGLLILAAGEGDEANFKHQADELLAAIRQLAGSSWATRMLNTLTLGHTPFQGDLFPTRERRLRFARQWLALAGAVLATDADGAEALVRDMYDDAYQVVMARLPLTAGDKKRGRASARPQVAGKEAPKRIRRANLPKTRTSPR